MAFAQQPDAIPEFEAVSIKLSNGADHGPPNSDGGPGTHYPEWFGANVTIRSLISRAYGLIDSQKQVSGPSWIDGQKFAIDARVPLGTTKQQFQKMLQKLTAERFGLVAHHEATALPVLELTVAKTGPKLNTSPPEADPPGMTIHGGPGGVIRLKSRQQAIATLAMHLSSPIEAGGAGRTVVDKTGLTGKYDFTLDYYVTTAAASAPVDSGLGVFEALQQQLGLKLVEAKENVDRIVIDHVEKAPTAN
jgi:uncharacterized protein (TIGR03435 family)